MLKLLRRNFLFAALPLVLVGGCSSESQGRCVRNTDRLEARELVHRVAGRVEGPAGQAPDPSHWAHGIGGNGWGNKELQYYTDSTNNTALDGAGNLLITAREETFMGNAYTSGRLTTKGIFEQAYGRFEARMKLVSGVGMWPAFWIMGGNIDEAGWPGAGEIDIMEQRGYDLRSVLGSLHGPDASGKDAPTHVQGAVARRRQREFSRLRHRVGSGERGISSRRHAVRSGHHDQPADQREVGLRPPVLHHHEPRGGRRLRRRSQRQHGHAQSIAIDHVRVSTRKP